MGAPPRLGEGERERGGERESWRGGEGESGNGKGERGGEGEMGSGGEERGRWRGREVGVRKREVEKRACCEALILLIYFITKPYK